MNNEKSVLEALFKLTFYLCILVFSLFLRVYEQDILAQPSVPLFYPVYGYGTYLLKEMVKLRSLKANSVDYSQFLPWNLTPKLREKMAIRTISNKKKRIQDTSVQFHLLLFHSLCLRTGAGFVPFSLQGQL